MGAHAVLRGEEDGTIQGEVNDSGSTGFEGKVAADGSFTASLTAFSNANLTGTIDANGYVTGGGEIFGRKLSFKSAGDQLAEEPKTGE